MLDNARPIAQESIFAGLDGKELKQIRNLSTLALAVLALLKGQPSHGWSLLQRLEETDRSLKPNSATLYETLGRLNKIGLIDEDRTEVYRNRIRRIFRTTGMGVAVLERHQSRLVALNPDSFSGDTPAKASLPG